MLWNIKGERKACCFDTRMLHKKLEDFVVSVQNRHILSFELINGARK